MEEMCRARIEAESMAHGGDAGPRARWIVKEMPVFTGAGKEIYVALKWGEGKKKKKSHVLAESSNNKKSNQARLNSHTMTFCIILSVLFDLLDIMIRQQSFIQHRNNNNSRVCIRARGRDEARWLRRRRRPSKEPRDYEEHEECNGTENRVRSQLALPSRSWRETGMCFEGCREGGCARRSRVLARRHGELHFWYPIRRNCG